MQAYKYIIGFCRCSHLSAEWEELKEACNRRAAHLSKAITREQVRQGTGTTNSCSIVVFVVRSCTAKWILSLPQLLSKCNGAQITWCKLIWKQLWHVITFLHLYVTITFRWMYRQRTVCVSSHLQLLLDCSELESRLTEMLNLVNSDDYGKDQMATQTLNTKHQVEHILKDS